MSRQIDPRVVPRCGKRMRPGWWCSRLPRHPGPCALHPKWWNLHGRALVARSRRAGRARALEDGDL